MAVRRGVAVGGGRHVVPAAARPAARRGAGDAVADAGAVRPARGAGGDRALPSLPARRAARVARAGRRGDRRRGRGGRALAGGGEYAAALERLPDDVLGALAPFAAWTSAATHAVLPLLATDAGLRLQVRTGVESHRARFGEGWRGGFWLPECAHAPWLHATLEEAGVHATCVDLTDVLGPGDPRHLRRWPPRRGRCSCRSTGRRSTSCGPGAATRPAPPTATTTTAPPATTTRGPTTARSTTRRGRPSRRRPTRPTSSRASPRAWTAAGCASARSTPSCSACGGTRGRDGSRSSSTRRRAPASSSCTSTTRWPTATRCPRARPPRR